jgi:hypothetical protein
MESALDLVMLTNTDDVLWTTARAYSLRFMCSAVSSISSSQSMLR